VARSEQLIEDVIKKIWPQGRPYARYDTSGEFIVGNKFRGLNYDGEAFDDPEEARMVLLENRKRQESYRKPLNRAQKTAVIIAGIGTAKGLWDRSLPEITTSVLGGMASWTSIRLIREICDKTIENLDERIKLTNEQSTLPREEE
jgi:hypothetical protein